MATPVTQRTGALCTKCRRLVDDCDPEEFGCSGDSDEIDCPRCDRTGELAHGEGE